MNVILVSRTQSKLEMVAKEIEEKFKVKTATIAVDFTSPGIVIYRTIEKEIQGKEIGVLVNNVGMANAAWDVFLEIPDLEKHIEDLIQCNVLSVPMMCKLILPQMVTRKKGLIINLSSTAAVLPTPCMAVYAATKAFVHKFSQDLRMEYEDKGIVIQSVLPGPVATPLIRMDKGNIVAPIAETYVESAIRTVESAPYTAGYFIHTISNSLSQAINFISPLLFKNIVSIRNYRERDRVIKQGYYK
jgi:17beta-estradiol 17-dehydrogenase / very-long-chain 3-oxoacyl-CoA reductase